ncbi:hypothetical protein OUZ56_023508 [Daphnia magna]|uniref:Uncharacterized protein n=1 Tax=Daphnia magna TaxID=35525 RepID=A0ABR0AZ81_9CRUS|nr:hypothetical protein OUZ56_023508 [Daphnia magna]
MKQHQHVPEARLSGRTTLPPIGTPFWRICQRPSSHDGCPGPGSSQQDVWFHLLSTRHMIGVVRTVIREDRTMK